MLSVLIPVYNYNCTQLVVDLHQQCVEVNIPFEILVLDDTSIRFKKENRKINDFKFAQYIESDIHYGRAKVRNELGRLAKYEHLLFIDADALVDSSDFIKKYIDFAHKADLIVGGVKYQDSPPKTNQLRWCYGMQREFKPAKERNKAPYSALSGFNFMIKRKVFYQHSFNEESINIEQDYYGHEDTLLGLQLQKQEVSVLHIDNQLIHDALETDEVFIEKSLVAVEKYVNNPIFRQKEVVEQIKIFRVFEKVKALGMVGMLSFMYLRLGRSIKNQLFKPSPSLRLFDFYRLCYLAYYYKKNRS